MSEDSTRTRHPYEWLDFAILGNDAGHYGYATKPVLESAAGVEFTDDQFHSLMQAIAELVAALCTEPPTRSGAKTFCTRLSKLRKSVEDIVEIFDLENEKQDGPADYCGTGLLETVRMNIYPFRDQSMGIDTAFEALRTASQELAQLEEGVNQTIPSQPGRRNIQEFPPFLRFCIQVREIWLTAGGSEQASGYYYDENTGQWKGGLGRLIMTIASGYSDPTGEPILVVSDSTVRGALRNVSSTNKNHAKPD